MAKVILRQDHGLESHPTSNRQEEPGTDLEMPGYKASGLSIKTTAAPPQKKKMQ